MDDMLQLSNLCLVALVFFYSLNLGPMLFESFTSDRTWASNPPESFSMFLGQYGHKTAHYWKVVSPLASLLFLVSLSLNWHSYARVLWLAVAFALYLTAQISTMAYFVPEQGGRRGWECVPGHRSDRDQHGILGGCGQERGRNRSRDPSRPSDR